MGSIIRLAGLCGLFLGLWGIPVAAAETKAKAFLKSTNEANDVQGTVDFLESGDSVKVHAEVQNVSPGEHGIHIHEFGSCKEDGLAAGSHYNPQGNNHGFLPEDGFTGAHAGDLGNIMVKDDGTGVLDLTLPKPLLTGKDPNIVGRSVVLHEGEDSFGQPDGRSGGRIACGSIILTASP